MRAIAAALSDADDLLQSLDRLIAMIVEAAERPKYRVATKPGKAARKRRTDQKTRRGQVKKLRSRSIGTDE